MGNLGLDASSNTRADIRFYKIKNNSDKTDYTLSSGTLGDGVTLPTSFSVLNWIIEETHDHNVLVIGARSKRLTQISTANSDMLILYVDYILLYKFLH